MTRRKPPIDGFRDMIEAYRAGQKDRTSFAEDFADNLTSMREAARYGAGIRKKTTTALRSGGERRGGAHDAGQHSPRTQGHFRPRKQPKPGSIEAEIAKLDPKVQTFYKKIRDDKHVRQVYKRIATLDLLYGSPELLKALGFDENNISRMLQGLFSSLHGFMPSEDVRSALSATVGEGENERYEDFVEVLYDDVLGLGPDSSEAEMDEKIEEFNTQAKHLKEWMNYPDYEKIATAAKLYVMGESLDNIFNNHPQIGQLKRYNPDEADYQPVNVFDEDPATRMIEESHGYDPSGVTPSSASRVSGRAASGPSTEPEAVDMQSIFTDLISESQDAFITLTTMRSILGDKDHEKHGPLKGELNKQFIDFAPEGIPDRLGSELVRIIKDPNEASEMLDLFKFIASGFERKDVTGRVIKLTKQELKQKLINIADAVESVLD